MNRSKSPLDQSYRWLREHWNATNLEIPDRLLEQWMLEPADDHMKPYGFPLAVFIFGFVQYEMSGNRVPDDAKRRYSVEQLLSLFSLWQLKLSLAEVHRHTNVRTSALPLFAFPENEHVDAWCDICAPLPVVSRPGG